MQFPVKEMKKRNWLPNGNDTIPEQMISLLNFFGVATPERWEQGWTKRQLAFRKSMNLKQDIAAETLIPLSRLNECLKKINSNRLTNNLISDLAKQLNIAPGILVGRLQHTRHIKYSEFNKFKMRYNWGE
jgi:hypothetical protein